VSGKLYYLTYFQKMVMINEAIALRDYDRGWKKIVVMIDPERVAAKPGRRASDHRPPLASGPHTVQFNVTRSDGNTISVLTHGPSEDTSRNTGTPNHSRSPMLSFFSAC
jgi:hypothetical protein